MNFGLAHKICHNTIAIEERKKKGIYKNVTMVKPKKDITKRRIKTPCAAAIHMVYKYTGHPSGGERIMLTKITFSKSNQVFIRSPT